MNRPARGFQYMDLADFEELLADKPDDERWELIGGRVVKMMVGAKWEHHRIVQNINLHLANRFRATGSKCDTFTETFWLKEKLLDLAVFPDVIVHCGQLQPEAASLNDPIVLVEVLSPGSEARDRFEKQPLYFRLPSLRHYVLVKRDRPLVEVFDWMPDGTWSRRREVEDLAAVVALPAIDAELPMAEVYRRVLAD